MTSEFGCAGCGAPLTDDHRTCEHGVFSCGDCGYCGDCDEQEA